MPLRFGPAPPTPWSRSLAEPQIDKTAYIHPFSKIIGEVHVGANVLVAPGTSIRADEGSPFHIGIESNVQDGVVIHGLEQGRVIGDDNNKYSVWIGDNTSITHMALIHGPAYVGDNCFIGFRSTVFNARVGSGCIVMMHALIQDVEIKPGKYIPSGAVITNQQQADRLPNVETADLEFADHVIGINQALRSGYRCAEDNVCLTQTRNEDQSFASQALNDVAMNNLQNTSLSPEIISQVRQLLMQGYQISTEHADKRRFRANAWNTCPAITTQQESGVISALTNYLGQYAGEYLRLVAIDPKAKKRIFETIIARPNGQVATGSKPVSLNSTPAAAPTTNYSQGNGSSSTATGIAEQVQQLLMQGYKIGTEHADKRRFRANAWHTCAPIASQQQSEVMNALDACIREHQGEYIRLVGIDAKAKRRVLETIIARPDGKVSNNVKPTSFNSSAASTYSNGSTAGSGSTSLDNSVAEQVQQLLMQGYKIGTEHADKRRFRANAWHTCAPIASQQQSEVMNALDACIREHQGEYIRLVGIDAKAKRRVLETIIARPDGKVANNAKPASFNSSSASSTSSASSASSSSFGSSSTTSTTSLESEVVEQIKNLLMQGHQVNAEYADKRRFRANAWNSCGAIASKDVSGVISALETCLTEHAKDYVRIVGVDTQAKKRVLEKIIQRP